MAETATAKTKRKPNWTQDECLLLATLVNEKKDVLRKKLGPNLTSKMKRDAWEKISSQLNASSAIKRSTEEIEKKWNNILSSCKSEISNFRKSSTATGGGPPSKPLSALAETVQMVIGESNAIITGIDGGIDSSVLHLITDDNVCTFQILQDVNCNTSSSQATAILPLSPMLCSSPPSMQSSLPVRSQKSPVLPHTISRAPRTSLQTQSKSEVIEELTIKKIKLEIEYFDLKVKALKRKLEE